MPLSLEDELSDDDEEITLDVETLLDELPSIDEEITLDVETLLDELPPIDEEIESPSWQLARIHRVNTSTPPLNFFSINISFLLSAILVKSQKRAYKGMRVTLFINNKTFKNYAI